MTDTILLEAQKALLFSLMGRLSSKEIIPNFSRPSSCVMEHWINGSVVFETFPAHVPAIDSDDGSFLVEPGRLNYLTYNYAIDHPVWIKGSSVNVIKDIVYLPNGVAKGERISFALGTGNTNIIRRTVKLPPGRDYVLTQVIALRGGQMSSDDVLKVTGEGVTSESVVSYAALNEFIDNYRILSLPFKTTGSSTNVIEDLGIAEEYTVLDVTNSTITLENLSIESGRLNGICVGFDGIEGVYTISNSQRVGSNQILTVTPATLVTNGVAAGNTARLTDPQSVNVNIEMYVTSASTLDWGGIQLEEGTFRTSMIYQDQEMFPRSDTYINYRAEDNPLIGMRSFSFYVDLKDWRGDGDIVTLGNVQARIINGKLNVRAGSVEITDGQDLPNPASIFVQVASETSSMSVYVNGKLINRSAISNFLVNEGDGFSLTSQGMRLFYSLVIFNRIFGDNQINVGEEIQGDLALVLGNKCRDFVYVATTLANKVLPPIIVPGAEQPLARAVITGINVGGLALMVDNADKFDISKGEILAIVERKTGSDLVEIGYVTIQGVSPLATPPNAILAVDSVSGIAIGDIISPSYVKRPGKASARLPFSAKDSQVIQAIDIPAKTITLNTTTSFMPGDIVIIQTAAGQDLGEYKIDEKSDIARTLKLEGEIKGMDVGDIVSAIRSSMEISPALYEIILLRDVSKVDVGAKGTNGFVLENRNEGPRLVEVMIQIPV